MSNVSYLSFLSVLLPLFAGIIHFKKLTPPYRVFIFFLVFGLLCDVVNFSLAKSYMNNVWVMNIFMLAEFAVYTYISLAISQASPVKHIEKIVIPAFLGVWIYLILIRGSITEFNNSLNLAECSWLILLAGGGLVKVSEDVSIPIYKNPVFLFLAATFIYFAGNLIVFSLANQVMKTPKPMMDKIWIIHSFWCILTNIIFMLSLLWTSGNRTYR